MAFGAELGKGKTAAPKGGNQRFWWWFQGYCERKEERTAALKVGCVSICDCGLVLVLGAGREKEQKNG